MKIQMLLRTVLIGATCLLVQPVALAAELPPAAHFFENPSFGGPVLSPNARQLALRVSGKGTRERLAVLDIATNTAKVVSSFQSIDIDQIRWISDDRLVFTTIDRTTAPGDVRHGPGLYAVNRDGSGFRQLASRTTILSSGGFNPLLSPYARLQPQPGKQNSEYIYVTLPTFSTIPNVEFVDLLKVNTLNGRFTTVRRPAATRSFMLDHQGEPRLAVSVEKDLAIIYYRDPGNDTWRALHSSSLYAGGGYTPIGFGPDGTLYARAHHGADKLGAFTVDLATGKLSSLPVITLKGYDFTGNLITSATAVLGVTYNSESQGVHWLDAPMAEIQKTLDAKLPDTVNLIMLAARPETPTVLVASFSDRKPRSYLMFNYKTGALNDIGNAHPNIRPSEMGQQEMVRYKARDGLEIPAYLTLPAGAKRSNLPLVVLVHGGPYVRGASFGWNPDTQFLASRGYAVLEPAFRGSTGYGDKHYKAGWKQWGLAMQDDIADGAKWAVAEGIVDPKRICIAGASYGGYATLMGLINDPELFKCGVAWVGVTDLGLLHSGHWSFESDLNENYKQYGFPVLIGDPVADAARFKATSPLHQAARLKQPLMLAYGTADKRVPLYHGTKFRDAVKVNNAQVEWIEYAEEGHGWTLPHNRIDFWTRVEKFLDRNIGSAKAQ